MIIAFVLNLTITISYSKKFNTGQLTTYYNYLNLVARSDSLKGYIEQWLTLVSFSLSISAFQCLYFADLSLK